MSVMVLRKIMEVRLYFYDHDHGDDDCHIKGDNGHGGAGDDSNFYKNGCPSMAIPCIWMIYVTQIMMK